MSRAKTVAFWTIVAVSAAVAAWASLARGQWPYLLMPAVTAAAWWGVYAMARRMRAFDQGTPDDAARGAARLVAVSQTFAIGLAAVMLALEAVTLAKMTHVGPLGDLPRAAIMKPVFILIGLLLAYAANATARGAFLVAEAHEDGPIGFKARRAGAWIGVLGGLSIALVAAVLPVEPINWALRAIGGIFAVMVVAGLAVRFSIAFSKSASPDGPGA